MNIREMALPANKYGVKCPIAMNAQYITIHNTANDASAANEIKYMQGNNNEISFHVAIDDKEVIQGLPLNRTAWHCGDGRGTGNMKSIGIEICYSRSGGPRYQAAEANAIEYVASMLKARGWGIDRVRKHQDWSGKFCPHRILQDGRWNAFKQAIANRLKGANTTPQQNTPQPVAQNGDRPGVSTYRVYANGKWYGWISGCNDVNGNGYAGVNGTPITGIQIKNDIGGNVQYQVHTNGVWLPYVTGYNTTNGNGYAGDLKNPIDGIRIKNKTYRVGTCVGGYLPWVGGNDFAGVFGKPIDVVQVK